MGKPRTWKRGNIVLHKDKNARLSLSKITSTGKLSHRVAVGDLPKIMVLLSLAMGDLERTQEGKE